MRNGGAARAAGRRMGRWLPTAALLVCALLLADLHSTALACASSLLHCSSCAVLDGSCRAVQQSDKRQRLVIHYNTDCRLEPDHPAVDAGVCFAFEPRDSGPKKYACLPSFMGIGTMKGGTAELLQYLAIHPNLQRWRRGGEAHFFDKVPSWEFLRRHYMRSYLQGGFEMTVENPDDAAKVLASTWTFEKTPAYLPMQADQIEWLHRVMPSLKLVVLFRDPVRRAFSHFQHLCRRGSLYRAGDGADLHGLQNTVQTRVGNTNWTFGHRLAISSLQLLDSPCSPDVFDAMLLKHGSCGRLLPTASKAEQHEPTRAAGGLEACHGTQGRDTNGTSLGECSCVLYRGRYLEQVERWRAQFPIDQFLFLNSEEFFARPAHTLDAIQAFLGLNRLDYHRLITKDQYGHSVLDADVVRARPDLSSPILGPSKATRPSYEPPSEAIVALLTSYYRPYSLELLAFLRGIGQTATATLCNASWASLQS